MSDQGNPPAQAAKPVGSAGVGSLFKRALAEQRDLKAERAANGEALAGHAPDMTTEAVELPKCGNCGAPRDREGSVCHFCGEAR